MSAAGAVRAQSTLGELVDQGALKLTPAEVSALGPLGVTRHAQDSEAILLLQADGRVAGTVVNKQGHGASEASGTWTLDARGKRCVDVEMPAFNMRWNQCGYTYRLGNRFFAVASDTDRGARVTAYILTAHVRQ